MCLQLLFKRLQTRLYAFMHVKVQPLVNSTDTGANSGFDFGLEGAIGDVLSWLTIYVLENTLINGHWQFGRPQSFIMQKSLAITWDRSGGRPPPWFNLGTDEIMTVETLFTISSAVYAHFHL